MNWIFDCLNVAATDPPGGKVDEEEFLHSYDREVHVITCGTSLIRNFA